jgi:D-3-phosphoglycerate dehydrogenase / 2-oxoglutarate reductase
VSKRVFVAIDIFDKACRGLVKKLQEQGFDVVVNDTGKELDYTVTEDAKYFEGADYIIAGLEKYDQGFFDQFPDVEVISRIGVGVDSIDLNAAKENDTKIYITSDRPSIAVAELCVSNMVALLRKTFKMSNFLHNKEWIPIQGRELRSCKVGILGYGSIGKQVVKRIHGFDAEIFAAGRTWDEKHAERYNVTKLSREELFKTCDVITIHLPLNKETEKHVSRELLLSMERGSIIINTSRSGVLDNEALKQLLKSGHIAGAGIDVFDEHRSIGPYNDCENVILTPHIGSHTQETRVKMEDCAVDNIFFHNKITKENDLAEIEKIVEHLRAYSPSHKR